MNVEIVSYTDHECELKIDNITVAEALRVYLNDQGIKFAAWRRDHITQPVTFRIESSGKSVKKAVSEAVSAISKDSEAIIKLVSK